MSRAASAGTAPATGRHGLLRATGWCLLVPVLAVLAYLGVGLVAVTLVGEPVLGTAVVAILTAVAVLAARRRRPDWFTYDPPRVEPFGPRLWGAVAALTALAFLSGQAAGLWVYFTQGSTGFEAVSESRREAGLLVALLLSLVLAPVGEEALLRGLVYPLLRRRVGIVVSVVVTTAVFALLHGNAVQVVSVLPLAVLAAALYELTRRLWPVVLVHLAFNLAAALVPVEAMALLADPVGSVSLLTAFGAALAAFIVQARRSRAEGAPRT